MQKVIAGQDLENYEVVEPEKEKPKPEGPNIITLNDLENYEVQPQVPLSKPESFLDRPVVPTENLTNPETATTGRDVLDIMSRIGRSAAVPMIAGFLAKRFSPPVVSGPLTAWDILQRIGALGASTSTAAMVGREWQEGHQRVFGTPPDTSLLGRSMGVKEDPNSELSKWVANYEDAMLPNTIGFIDDAVRPFIWGAFGRAVRGHYPDLEPAFGDYPQIRAPHSAITKADSRSLIEDYATGPQRQRSREANRDVNDVARAKIQEIGGYRWQQLPTKTEYTNMFHGDVIAAQRNLETHLTNQRRGLDAIAELNRVRYGGYDSRGPVFINELGRAVYDFSQSQNKKWSENAAVEMPRLVARKWKGVEDFAEDISNALNINAKGQLVESPASKFVVKGPGDLRGVMDILIELKKSANIGDPRQTQQQKIFERFYNALDQDIQNSISRWGNGSQDALKFYHDQKRTGVLLEDWFQKKGTIRDLLMDVGSRDTVLDEVLKDSKSVKQAYVQGRDMKTLRAYQLQRLWENAWDPVRKKVDSDRLMGQWTDPDREPVYRALFTNAQRQDITNFFRVAARVGNLRDEPLSGQRVLSVFKGALYVSGGLVVAGRGVSMPYTIAVAGTMGVSMSMGAAARFILLNPKRARLLSLGLTTPKTAPDYNFIRNGILGALKGAVVVAHGPNGEETPGRINDKGEFVPDEPYTPQGSGQVGSLKNPNWGNEIAKPKMFPPRVAPGPD